MKDRLPGAVALAALAALTAACAATPAAAPSTAPVATVATTPATGDRTYRPPREFQGLPDVPDSAFVHLIRGGVVKGDLPASTVGTSYISADDVRNITIRAVPQHSTDPAGDLEALLARELPAPELRSRFTDTDPGGRGGAMRCGFVRGDDSTVSALCLWADTSMLGVYGEYARGSEQNVDLAAQHAREFRTLAEVPS